MKKPNKKIYKGQKQIQKKIINFLLPKLKEIPQIEKAYLWGSIINGDFGVYQKKWREHIGSDIDLIILLKKHCRVPKEFKYLEIDKLWFKGYKPREFRKIKIEGNEHKVDILLIKRSHIKDAMKDIKGKSKLIYRSK